MADKKPPRKRTGAYQHGVYLGPGKPNDPPTETPEPPETIGRNTGAYQNGREIGATESSDTQSTDSAGPTSHRKPGIIARTLGRGKGKK